MPPLLPQMAYAIVSPIVKRRLFRKPYIPLLAYLVCYGQAFEEGAILGLAHSDSILTFAKLFCNSGHESEVVTFAQQLARELLSAGTGSAQGLMTLAVDAEQRRIEANWRESGITDTEAKRLLFSFRIPLENALKNMTVAITKGIGLGSAFPELTRQLWEKENE